MRSSLVYAQEVFFSASRTYLKKLESIDSRAVKLALGVPVHSSTLRAYKLAGWLPLSDLRMISAANYITRSRLVDNSNSEEVVIRSDLDFPLRSRKMKCLQTIASYTSDLFNKSGVVLDNIAKSPISPIPSWELERPYFDFEYVDIKKLENPNLLSSIVKEHLYEKYSNHFQVFTDGSVLENDNAGSGFVIPALI